MPTVSYPHTNPNGQKIRKGGMWLVNCKPGCQSEFRSASNENMIHGQLETAGWQVNEEQIAGQKVITYRCPGHRIIDRGRISGDPLPSKKIQTGKEKKAQGRSSHDGGETP